jgi:hypothetical protein
VQVGTPAIFGMNFQTVSTAQKLPSSDGLRGGYQADGLTSGPLLRRALDFVNAKLGTISDALRERHLQNKTVIIISAKHGQSPQTPSALTRIPDGPILSALNDAWNAAGHPGELVAFAIDDDGMLIWLNDRSPTAEQFARTFLLGHSGTGNDINGDPKPYTNSGLAQAYAGPDAASFIGVPFSDARVPDIVGISQYGVVYTGKKAKIAEHGGDKPQDRHVPLVFSADGLKHAGSLDGAPVETTQIAPTILQLLGLDPTACTPSKSNTPRCSPSAKHPFQYQMTARRRKTRFCSAVESSPSSWWAFRLATFVDELTLKGVTPELTTKLPAVPPPEFCAFSAAVVALPPWARTPNPFVLVPYTPIPVELFSPISAAELLAFSACTATELATLLVVFTCNCAVPPCFRSTATAR